VGLEAGVDGKENCALTGIRFLDRSVRNKSIYLLHHPIAIYADGDR
jgi:hypothetical protein